MDKSSIYTDNICNVLENMYEKQKNARNTKSTSNILIMTDNYIFSEEEMESSTMKRLFFNSRMEQITGIFNTSYIDFEFSSILSERMNTDYVFLFRTNITKERTDIQPLCVFVSIF